MTRALSYAKAEDLRPLLTATVLSSRGSIQTDPRTNTIIITDLDERLTRAMSLLVTLDRGGRIGNDALAIELHQELAESLGEGRDLGLFDDGRQLRRAQLPFHRSHPLLLPLRLERGRQRKNLSS